MNIDGILLDDQFFIPLSNVAVIDRVEKKVQIISSQEWVSFKECHCVTLDPARGLSNFHSFKPEVVA